jgi:hypothetical protein
MFRLERPNMAVNDPRVSAQSGGVTYRRRFQMWNTWDIREDHPRREIIEGIRRIAASAPGGRLRHLVLSCHGLPGHMQLGEGFGRAQLPLFGPLHGKVEKLWLPNCLTANIPTAAAQAQYDRDYPGVGVSDGNSFCSELARRLGAYVVAATELQCELVTDIPPDMMTSFEGLVLSYAPDGSISWSARNRSMWMRTAPGGAPQCIGMPD